MSTLVAGRLRGGEVNNGGPAARPSRRTFSAEYKLAILETYDSLTEPGAKSALLRGEGLYSSHVVEWRRARDAGALAAQGRGRRRSPELLELERLRRENERLRSELSRTKAALDIVGRAHALLEQLSESGATEPRSSR